MPMEIKINMDEKSGKITNISFNGDLNVRTRLVRPCNT